MIDRRQLLLAGATGALAGTTTLAAGEASAAAAGFNSTFNSNKWGWTNVYGSWVLRKQKLHCDGIPGYVTSVKHANTYSDFTFEARMRRSGNFGGGAANRLILRGDPTSLGGDMLWQPCYIFQYSNSGFYSVFVIGGSGAATQIVGWTYVGSTLNNFVVIRASVAGSTLALSLNGTPVWSGTDSTLALGQVGMGFWTAPDYWGRLDVDYAWLTPGARMPRPAATRIGRPTPGGSVHQAPR